MSCDYNYSLFSLLYVCIKCAYQRKILTASNYIKYAMKYFKIITDSCCPLNMKY